MHEQLDPNYKSNLILNSLPDEEINILSPHLELVEIENEEIITLAGNEMRHFYFIVSGVISLCSETSSGQSIEVAMVGNEGCIGLCMLYGEYFAPLNKIAMGHRFKALRIPINTIRTLEKELNVLSRLLHRYLFKQMTHMSQNLVCTHYHSIEQQVCKWLLLRCDFDSNEIHITQNKLSELIGVRRAGVTEVINKLSKQGTIKARRGIIEVSDYDELLKSSCECRGIINNAT